ncbi:hypothetical protein PYCCODRAFT_1427883 [Trametes coccinea BRFM310]|uniref:F-box domain-containing protein n=1 Tax=Trametes coccinea (strain BRFM310) TaxID=1353009 RepID=A0A1Y2IB43_TRAC3|nr:hypothetical protein PYCCODRAFT_1427883 [Trametes coccinea BRFM310]
MKRRKRGAKKPRDSVVATGTIIAHLPTLPLDVWHIVFENAPKATLQACSCVSRAWREVAVPFLFASIEIIRSAGDYADTCEELLNTYPHLARHIRQLELRRETDWSSKVYPVVSRDLLATLLTRLPCLEELRLRSLWISPSQRQSSDVPTARRLNKLILVDCGEEGRDTSPVDPRILLDFASTVPVNMVNIEVFTTQRQTVSPVPTPPLRLLDCHSLQLGSRWEERYRHSWDNMSWVCDALRDAFAPRRLTSLSLCFWILGDDPMSMRALGRFLHHACSHTMQRLSFPVMINSAVASGPNNSDKAEFWRVLYLHEFTEIDTFEMSLTVVSRGTHPDSPSAPRLPLGAVCVAIFSILPPTVRKVTLTLWDVKEASQVKNKRMLNLSALDDALEARAPVLEKVRLVFRGEWYLLEFAEAATKAMAKCKKRRMLEVVDWFHHTGQTWKPEDRL